MTVETDVGALPEDEMDATVCVTVDDEGAARREPHRRCIVTGVVRPKAELLRFVVSPEGEVVPDLSGTLPGRGMWVLAERAVLQRAIAKKAFARAAKRSVSIKDGLVEDVTAQLRRRCLDLLGLARGAGQVVAGFAKVDKILRQGKVAILLAAEDGAADGREKLLALKGAAPVVELFTSAELGAAVGRDGACVHVVLTAGGLAKRLLAEAGRYGGLRG